MGLEKSILVVVLLFKFSLGLTGKCMLKLVRLASKTKNVQAPQLHFVPYISLRTFSLIGIVGLENS